MRWNVSNTRTTADACRGTGARAETCTHLSMLRIVSIAYRLGPSAAVASGWTDGAPGGASKCTESELAIARGRSRISEEGSFWGKIWRARAYNGGLGTLSQRFPGSGQRPWLGDEAL